MDNEMTDLLEVKTFILAGKATLGIHSDTSDTTYWFTIFKQSTPGLYHVLISGIWKRVGTIYNGEFKGVHDTPQRRAFEWGWDSVCKNLKLKKLHFLHEGRCGMCGRPLRDEVSMARGIGPECFKRLNK